MKMGDWGRVLVSILVVAGFIGVTVIYMTRKLDGNPVPEILSILLGSLATNFTTVVAYWMGSSSGSTSKDVTIENMSAKVPAVATLLGGFLIAAVVSKAYLVLA
jgi:mannose/fructose/N-acetylgalactosamine-specific phosphotransferase system component IID